MHIRRHFTISLVGFTTLLAGCVSPLTMFSPSTTTAAKPADSEEGAIGDPNDPRPRVKAFLAGEGLATTPAQPGEGAQLVAAWDNKIRYAPDTTRGGDPVPGLVARLWLFGPDVKTPIEPDGELIVGVWDQTPKTNGGAPVLMEVWHIDRNTAAKFRRPDFLGWGYSLFLPWQRYNVDLKQVNVQVRYNGADGRNLVAPSQILNLDHSATLQRAAEKLGIKNPLATTTSPLETLPKPSPRPWPEDSVPK